MRFFRVRSVVHGHYTPLQLIAVRLIVLFDLVISSSIIINHQRQYKMYKYTKKCKYYYFFGCKAASILATIY